MMVVNGSTTNVLTPEQSSSLRVVQQATPLPAEPLPPYTPIAETLHQQLPYAATSHVEGEQVGDNGSEDQPPAFEQLVAIDNVGSSSIGTVYGYSPSFDTFQCVEAASTMTFTFEGVRGVHVSVRTDDADRYGGQVCIQSRRCGLKSVVNGDEVPLPSISSDSTEHSAILVKFAQCPGYCGQKTGGGIGSEYEIVVPTRERRIQQLNLRLSENSHLDMRQCAGTEELCIDVAVVEGSVVLRQIPAIRGIRVSIGSGTIEAQDFRCLGDAQFVAMQGRIHLERAAIIGLLLNTTLATVAVADSCAHRISVKTQTAPVSLHRTNATDTIDVSSVSGAVSLDDISTCFLTVATDTASVSGVWAVSEQLRIFAGLAAVHGRLQRIDDGQAMSALGGCECIIRTRGKPVHLQVDENFSGTFDLRARGSVVRFDPAAQNPPYTSFTQYFLTWMQGTVFPHPHPAAVAPFAHCAQYRLFVENENAPVIVTTAAAAA
ncbi:hypothetical protein GGH99_004346 [Coemansia sp. RSA 1285]|nr:hypothetical protein GGH99_004346 [Coemansia sp. RSA 1285]